MYMFLKQERPDTEDFVIHKYLAVKEKYVETLHTSKKTKKVFIRHPYKNVCFFAYYQNILGIYNFFPIKNYIFLADEGSPPPPLKVMSAIK